MKGMIPSPRLEGESVEDTIVRLREHNFGGEMMDGERQVEENNLNSGQQGQVAGRPPEIPTLIHWGRGGGMETRRSDEYRRQVVQPGDGSGY